MKALTFCWSQRRRWWSQITRLRISTDNFVSVQSDVCQITVWMVLQEKSQHHHRLEDAVSGHDFSLERSIALFVKLLVSRRNISSCLSTKNKDAVTIVYHRYPPSSVLFCSPAAAERLHLSWPLINITMIIRARGRQAVGSCWAAMVGDKNS